MLDSSCSPEQEREIESPLFPIGCKNAKKGISTTAATPPCQNRGREPLSPAERLLLTDFDEDEDHQLREPGVVNMSTSSSYPVEPTSTRHQLYSAGTAASTTKSGGPSSSKKENQNVASSGSNKKSKNNEDSSTWSAAGRSADNSPKNTAHAHRNYKTKQATTLGLAAAAPAPPLKSKIYTKAAATATFSSTPPSSTSCNTAVATAGSATACPVILSPETYYLQEEEEEVDECESSSSGAAAGAQRRTMLQTTSPARSPGNKLREEQDVKIINQSERQGQHHHQLHTTTSSSDYTTRTTTSRGVVAADPPLVGNDLLYKFLERKFNEQDSDLRAQFEAFALRFEEQDMKLKHHSAMLEKRELQLKCSQQEQENWVKDCELAFAELSESVAVKVENWECEKMAYDTEIINLKQKNEELRRQISALKEFVFGEDEEVEGDEEQNSACCDELDQVVAGAGMIHHGSGRNVLSDDNTYRTPGSSSGRGNPDRGSTGLLQDAVGRPSPGFVQQSSSGNFHYAAKAQNKANSFIGGETTTTEQFGNRSAKGHLNRRWMRGNVTLLEILAEEMEDGKTKLDQGHMTNTDTDSHADKGNKAQAHDNKRRAEQHGKQPRARQDVSLSAFVDSLWGKMNPKIAAMQNEQLQKLADQLAAKKDQEIWSLAARNEESVTKAMETCLTAQANKLQEHEVHIKAKLQAVTENFDHFQLCLEEYQQRLEESEQQSSKMNYGIKQNRKNSSSCPERDVEQQELLMRFKHEAESRLQWMQEKLDERASENEERLKCTTQQLQKSNEKFVKESSNAITELLNNSKMMAKRMAQDQEDFEDFEKMVRKREHEREARLIKTEATLTNFEKSYAETCEKQVDAVKEQKRKQDSHEKLLQQAIKKLHKEQEQMKSLCDKTFSETKLALLNEEEQKNKVQLQVETKLREILEAFQQETEKKMRLGLQNQLKLVNFMVEMMLGGNYVASSTSGGAPSTGGATDAEMTLQLPGCAAPFLVDDVDRKKGYNMIDESPTSTGNKLQKVGVVAAACRTTMPPNSFENVMAERREDDVEGATALVPASICSDLVSQLHNKWHSIVQHTKARSFLELLHKKADYSVLRLLQISQQHADTRIDRLYKDFREFLNGLHQRSSGQHNVIFNTSAAVPRSLKMSEKERQFKRGTRKMAARGTGREGARDLQEELLLQNDEMDLQDDEESEDPIFTEGGGHQELPARPNTSPGAFGGGGACSRGTRIKHAGRATRTSSASHSNIKGGLTTPIIPYTRNNNYFATAPPMLNQHNENHCPDTTCHGNHYVDQQIWFSPNTTSKQIPRNNRYSMPASAFANVGFFGGCGGDEFENLKIEDHELFLDEQGGAAVFGGGSSSWEMNNFDREQEDEGQHPGAQQPLQKTRSQSAGAVALTTTTPASTGARHYTSYHEQVLGGNKAGPTYAAGTSSMEQHLQERQSQSSRRRSARNNSANRAATGRVGEQQQQQQQLSPHKTSMRATAGNGTARPSTAGLQGQPGHQQRHVRGERPTHNLLQHQPQPPGGAPSQVPIITRRVTARRPPTRRNMNVVHAGGAHFENYVPNQSSSSSPGGGGMIMNHDGMPSGQQNPNSPKNRPASAAANSYEAGMITNNGASNNNSSNNNNLSTTGRGSSSSPTARTNTAALNAVGVGFAESLAANAVPRSPSPTRTSGNFSASCNRNSVSFGRTSSDHLPTTGERNIVYADSCTGVGGGTRENINGITAHNISSPPRSSCHQPNSLHSYNPTFQTAAAVAPSSCNSSSYSKRMAVMNDYENDRPQPLRPHNNSVMTTSRPQGTGGETTKGVADHVLVDGSLKQARHSSYFLPGHHLQAQTGAHQPHQPPRENVYAALLGKQNSTTGTLTGGFSTSQSTTTPGANSHAAKHLQHQQGGTTSDEINHVVGPGSSSSRMNNNIFGGSTSTTDHLLTRAATPAPKIISNSPYPPLEPQPPPPRALGNTTSSAGAAYRAGAGADHGLLHHDPHHTITPITVPSGIDVAPPRAMSPSNSSPKQLIGSYNSISSAIPIPNSIAEMRKSLSGGARGRSNTGNYSNGNSSATPTAGGGGIGNGNVMAWR
ncbi:unnamed protein product [Amoebophrya sp. A120]|nr:unnamed protein product [Amoebophrya sp. A120]|eukprot:GSA120T00016193001.1